MNKIINISTGEVKKGYRNNTLISNGIGSCIVVPAINFEKHIGGLAHIMLPGIAPAKEILKSKYAENAIQKLLQLLEVKNNDYSKIQVCLIGAGNVLKKVDDVICDCIINSLLEILYNSKIEISATALGGFLRRSVRFDVGKGEVSYSEGDSEFTLLHSWHLQENKDK